MFSDTGRGHDILIDIDVVYVQGYHTAHSFFLSQHHADGSLHDERNYTQTESQTCQAVSFPINCHGQEWSQWLVDMYLEMHSSKDTFESFCWHSCSLAVQISALVVNISTWWLSSWKSITRRTLDLFCCSMTIRQISPLGGPSFYTPPESLQLLDTSTPLLYSPSGAQLSDHFHVTVQSWLWWLKVAVKSGSFIEMTAHLATHPSLICICSDSPTAMPPNTFMASIPNSRLNPSGLLHTTNTLVLAEPPSSMDTVTIPMLQHGWDMPLIVMTIKSQLLLTFLLLCQFRLAKIYMSTTLVSLEMWQTSYKSLLQERPCFFPNRTLHARHVHVLFRLCGKLFLSLQWYLYKYSDTDFQDNQISSSHL